MKNLMILAIILAAAFSASGFGRIDLYKDNSSRVASFARPNHTVQVEALLNRGTAAVEAFRTLSPEQMKKDFGLFKRALLELHPGLYRYNTPIEMEKKFADFESKLAGPLGEDRFFILVSQFLSGIKCGHTYLNPYNQKNEMFDRFTGRRTYFPFYFEFVDGSFIVTRNASDSKLPVGSAIDSINGVGIDEIVEALASVSTADGDGTLLSRLDSIGIDRESGPSYSLFDIYFPLFFPLKDGAFEIRAIDYETQDGVKLTVPAMTKEERTAAMEKRYGRSPGYDDGWKFSFLEDGTGYLKIDNFITWKLSFDYRKFLANAFVQMKAKDTANLIIDIRNSDGGDSTIGKEILRYLHKSPFPCNVETRTYVRTAKADAELLTHVSVYEEEIKAALLNGLPEGKYRKADNGLLEYFESEGKCKEIEPYADRFQGKVYLLVGPANASAAFSLAQRFKEDGVATLIGRMTGGNLNGFNGGAYLFFNLPESGFEFDIPVFAYHPADPLKASDQGVKPDVNVPLSSGDIGSGFDRALEKAKELISASEKK